MPRPTRARVRGFPINRSPQAPRLRPPRLGRVPPHPRPEGAGPRESPKAPARPPAAVAPGPDPPALRLRSGRSALRALPRSPRSGLRPDRASPLPPGGRSGDAPPHTARVRGFPINRSPQAPRLRPPRLGRVPPHPRPKGQGRAKARKPPPDPPPPSPPVPTPRPSACAPGVRRFGRSPGAPDRACARPRLTPPPGRALWRCPAPHSPSPGLPHKPLPPSAPPAPSQARPRPSAPTPRRGRAARKPESPRPTPRRRRPRSRPPGPPLALRAFGASGAPPEPPIGLAPDRASPLR